MPSQKRFYPGSIAAQAFDALTQIAHEEMPENAWLRKSTMPLHGFSAMDAFTTEPMYLRRLLRDVARQEGTWPETVKRLSGVEPTVEAGHSAHARKGGEGWYLGVPTKRKLLPSLFETLDAQTRGWLTGGGTYPSPGGMYGNPRIAQPPGGGLAMSVFEDPFAHTPPHEVGHALAFRYQDWLSKHGGDPQLATWDDFLNTVVTENFDENKHYSGYAGKSQVKALNRLLDPKSFTKSEKTQEALERVRDRRAALRAEVEDVARLPLWAKEKIAVEPLAEAFTAAHAPRRPGGVVVPTAATQRATSAGNYLTSIIKGTRGFEGGATLPTMLKGAGLFGLPLAGEIAGPMIPNKFLRDLTTGAARGAGVGSMLGAPGAAVGAGIGGLLSQVL